MQSLSLLRVPDSWFSEQRGGTVLLASSCAWRVRAGPDPKVELGWEGPSHLLSVLKLPTPRPSEVWDFLWTAQARQNPQV